MIEAKANAQYTPAAEEIEERERYQRFSVENLSCFPARNQPAPDNYVDVRECVVCLVGIILFYSCLVPLLLVH